MQNDKQQPPIHKLELCNLNAAVWDNAGENGSFYKVSFSKTYKDVKTGELKDTQSFTRKELRAVKILAEEAEEYIDSLTA